MEKHQRTHSEASGCGDAGGAERVQNSSAAHVEQPGLLLQQQGAVVQGRANKTGAAQQTCGKHTIIVTRLRQKQPALTVFQLVSSFVNACKYVRTVSSKCQILRRTIILRGGMTGRYRLEEQYVGLWEQKKGEMVGKQAFFPGQRRAVQ